MSRCLRIEARRLELVPFRWRGPIERVMCWTRSTTSYGWQVRWGWWMFYIWTKTTRLQLANYSRAHKQESS